MNHDARLIVFDWDGTLMDSEKHIVSCLRAASQDLDFVQHDDDMLKSIIGLGLKEALDTLFPGKTDENYRAYTDRYRHYFYSDSETPAEFFDGAEELLCDLHQQNYLLAIATGKGRNGLDHVLDKTGIGDLFHVTRCADETRSKPHPQMLLEIIEASGVKANETIMIGDTEFDMQMANSAGTHAIAVSYGVHEKQRLLQCQPANCFDSLNELRGWLLNEEIDAA